MGYSYVYPPLGGRRKGFGRKKHSSPSSSFEHLDFDNDVFREEEIHAFDDFHVGHEEEHMEPHFTPSPHDDGRGGGHGGFHVGTKTVSVR